MRVASPARAPHVSSTPALALPLRNRLLGALSREELAVLLPHLESVQLGDQDTFPGPTSAIDSVFFPETAVVSFVSAFEDGGTVEVGTAGCEGMVGLPV